MKALNFKSRRENKKALRFRALAMRASARLQQVRPAAGGGLQDVVLGGPVAPLVEGYLLREREVLLEKTFRAPTEIGPQDHGIELEVVEQASPIHVRRAHGRPHALDDRVLGVQQAVLALVDLHARLEQLLVVRAPRMEDDPA